MLTKTLICEVIYEDSHLRMALSTYMIYIQMVTVEGKVFRVEESESWPKDIYSRKRRRTISVLRR